MVNPSGVLVLIPNGVPVAAAVDDLVVAIEHGGVTSKYTCSDLG